jgi:hypothetical protein
MNKSEKLLSTLAWTKADFEAANEEIPEELTEDDLHTEGELMNREDVDEFLAETHKVLLIAKEHHPDLFDGLYEQFLIDVHYLEELGKITPEEAAGLQKKDNYM